MNIVTRIKNILLSPKTEWGVIEAEQSSVSSIFIGYLVLLAAIPAVCSFVSSSLIGVGAFGMSVRVPILIGIVALVFRYVFSLGAVYLVALITDALAPNFGGQKSFINAFKLAAYSVTPAWLAGVLHILPVPGIGILIFLISLYSIFLFWQGIPVLMKSPQDKAPVYAVVIFVINFVISLIFGLIVGGVTMIGYSASPSVTFNTPNGSVSVDGGKMAEYTQRLEQASKKMQEAQDSNDPNAMAKAAANAMGAVAGSDASHQPLPPGELKAMLPEAIGDMKRESFEAQGGSAMGIANSTANASYRSGEKNLRLSITDMGGLAGIASFAAWANVTSERETDEMVERTYKSGTRTIHEQAYKNGGRVEVSYLLQSGVVIEVKGEGFKLDEAKQLIESLNLARLEAVGKG